MWAILFNLSDPQFPLGKMANICYRTWPGPAGRRTRWHSEIVEGRRFILHRQAQRRSLPRGLSPSMSREDNLLSVQAQQAGWEEKPGSGVLGQGLEFPDQSCHHLITDFSLSILSDGILEWWWGFRADGQERILETCFVQKGDFIKVWGQDPWAERAALGL